MTSLSDVSGEGIGALSEQNEKYGIKNEAETMMLTWFIVIESNERFGFHYWF